MVWTADGIPPLNTYTEALQHFDAVRPYQKNSNHAGEKPWGTNRRYTRSLIEKRTVDGIENVVVCRYYGTDVIFYFPDGTIKLSQAHNVKRNNDGEMVQYIWDSVSTGLVIRAGLGSFQSSFKDRIARSRSQNYYVDNNNKYHLIKAGITILPNGEVEGGTEEYVYKLCKTKMAELRKKYKSFTDYGDLILKFCNDVSINDKDFATGKNPYKKLTTETYAFRHYNIEEYVDVRAAWFTALDAAVELTDENERADAFFPLFQAVVVHAAKRDWLHNDVAALTGMRWRLICEPVKFREYFYELIRYEYAYELFDKEVATKNRPASAANKNYVELGRKEARTNLQQVSVSQ